MDIGLYQLKTPFAKLIRALIPLCRNIDPNHISWAIVPLGIVVAACYYLAPAYPYLYLAGPVLIFCRMVVATLDGLVAIEYGKSTPMGEMVNRIAPEIADIMMMGAILLSRPEYGSLAVPVLLVAWATSFFCLIGLVAKRPIQSVGPCGQTDRLAALMVFSLLQFTSWAGGWGIDFMLGFLGWTIAGGTLTIILRATRSARAKALA
jgi:CDP-diacylglycerol--glycerol-3-phosphate 3-phosphatidyltransferase